MLPMNWSYSQWRISSDLTIISGLFMMFCVACWGLFWVILLNFINAAWMLFIMTAIALLLKPFLFFQKKWHELNLKNHYIQQLEGDEIRITATAAIIKLHWPFYCSSRWTSLFGKICSFNMFIPFQWIDWLLDIICRWSEKPKMKRTNILPSHILISSLNIPI